MEALFFCCIAIKKTVLSHRFSENFMKTYDFAFCSIANSPR